MAGSPTLLPESRLGSTLRRGAWWTEILPVIIVLGGFGIYATLRAFEGKYYDWGPYLSLLFTAHRPRAPLVEIFSRAVDPRRASRLSCYLLLLPQSLLPRILPGSPRLFRW